VRAPVLLIWQSHAQDLKGENHVWFVLSAFEKGY